MAHPETGDVQANRARRSRLLRCIAIMVLVAIIVVLGVVVLVIWLVIRPSQIVYTVEDGSIGGFDLRGNTLNATFKLSLGAYNPNRRVAIYYDLIDVDVWFEEQMIAFGDVPPFFQPHRNVAHLAVKALAQSMPLRGYVSSDLRHQRSSGYIKLEVLMKARIHFKVGVWKSMHYNLRVSCPSVVLHFRSSNGFHRTNCGVHL
ncbi:NDR1/HIN1-like protein 10 [Magnolia sinica]|uniref:NDR1/HIN1-like protein 10 n=1 Tax=Magnolia sinica TaxID=86752 RepID=UPI00265AAFC8|nr:NDR1/HIN1-like protein 10 [Magnolia sinica]